MSKSRMIVARRSGGPSSVRCSRSGATLLRLGVDEADEVDPVLGMLQELPPDQLSDLPRADNHSVLLVRDAGAAEGSRSRAAERDQGDGERPEECELSDVGVRKTRQPRSHDENPRADRDHVEDVQHVVDRGMVSCAPRHARRGRRAWRRRSMQAGFRRRAPTPSSRRPGWEHSDPGPAGAEPR